MSHWLPVRFNSDERIERARRQAATGDPEAQAAYLRSRLRARTILPEALRLAAALGDEPSAAALGVPLAYAPFGDLDAAMLAISQDNEWGHWAAELWAWSLCEGTRWIWEDVAPVDRLEQSGLPIRVLDLLNRWLENESPCAEERHGTTASMANELFYLEEEVGDAMELTSESEALTQWVEALETTVTIFGSNMHMHWKSTLWRSRHTAAAQWGDLDVRIPVPEGRHVHVPLYAHYAREVYRYAVWAVDVYRGGSGGTTLGPVLDQAQLDVDRWTREIMLPRLLA